MGRKHCGGKTGAKAMTFDILKDSPLAAIWKASGGGGRDEGN